MFEVLKDFTKKSDGLEMRLGSEITILQKEDKKSLQITSSSIEELLVRKDQDEKVFLQINLNSGKKLLLTNNWVGFKPMVIKDSPNENVPNVVTTPDLVSVFEAIEESKRMGVHTEVHMLRNVFLSILAGAEDVGFDMSEERSWLQRLGVTSGMSA
jgi:hypothetical protein